MTRHVVDCRDMPTFLKVVPVLWRSPASFVDARATEHEFWAEAAGLDRETLAALVGPLGAEVVEARPRDPLAPPPEAAFKGPAVPQDATRPEGWTKDAETTLRALCAKRGLVVRWSPASNTRRGGKVFAHVMVEDGRGRRVADWWPSTGKWRLPAGKSGCDKTAAGMFAAAIGGAR